jgi:hypothetical protein
MVRGREPAKICCALLALMTLHGKNLLKLKGVGGRGLLRQTDQWIPPNGTIARDRRHLM